MTDKTTRQQDPAKSQPSVSEKSDESAATTHSLPIQNRQFSPNQILQMQRVMGNQRTQKFLQAKRAVIQLERDGLMELAPGIRGEVGIEGKIKKDEVITKTDSSTYTVPAEAHVFVHEIEDEDNYFVQIPGYVVKELTEGKDVSGEELKNKKAGNDGDPIRGTVRKKAVKETTGDFEHKKVRKALFPHPPTPDDVNQRNLGNCYFLSALGSVAAQHPTYLQDMMTDGEDTITVRFYRPEKAPQTGFRAEYITVRKSVVKKNQFLGGGLYSSTDVPWPALATKAYAAWDGHDKAGLPGFTKTYEGIAGGHSNSVFEHILGEKATKEAIHKGIGTGYVNTAIGEDVNLYLPGHPKRPVVQPWDSDLYRDFSPVVSSQQYGAYLTKDDSDEDKVRAFVEQEVVGPINVAMSSVKVNKMGAGLFRLKIAYLDVLQNAFKGVGKADVQAWGDFVKSDTGKTALDNVLKIGSTAGIMDRGSFQQLLKKAKVSSGGQNNFMNYVKDFVSGTPSDPYYNPTDLALYTKISDHLAKGGMVNASTPEYGKGGGRSGNEDVETVPGIAGGHAYTVLGLQLDEESGRRFIRLRNPWGSMGMGYSKDFGTRKEIKSGVFDLEFSDFMRYFVDLQYSASSFDTDLSFKVADIKEKRTRKRR